MSAFIGGKAAFRKLVSYYIDASAVADSGVASHDYPRGILGSLLTLGATSAEVRDEVALQRLESPEPNSPGGDA